ncbi:hypothetical protein KAZ82_01200, partial [Candidatus Babeliales bacterium]|nr:hypothetical protein [Candidatus Babeliales bacterium]
CCLQQSILMTAQANQALLPSVKHLDNSVVAYPIRAVFNDGTVQQGITNRSNRALAPAVITPILRQANFSVLPLKAGDFKSYPKGAALFAGYSDLIAQFDTMIAMFQSNPEYVTFFRKVHIAVLCELYHYLMGIYTNFNLQHAGISQSLDGQLHVDIPKFLKNEAACATNSKTLIINHLINIIESQFNGAICSYVPGIAQIYASHLGQTLIQNDFSLDLSEFVKTQTEPSMIAYKKNYLQAMSTYLKFFQNFTGYLLKQHPKHKNHFTAFVDIAEQINHFLYDGIDANADKQSVALLKMKPPLFTFNYDDVRALKMIPYLAKNLPKNSQKIMWPSQMVQAANEGLVLTMPDHAPHPLAYFRTATGTVVKNVSDASQADLYLSVKVGQNLFEEKLIPEPDWLGSWNGIVKILRASFGDFTALLGLNILDPCLEALVQLIVLEQTGQDANSVPTTAIACMQWVQMAEQFKKRSLITTNNQSATVTTASTSAISSNFLQQISG